MIIRRILDNPHYLAGSLVAKLAVNYMTACWAVCVIVQKDAIARSGYAVIATYAHEDVIAWLLLAISVMQTFWLWTHRLPLRFGSGGYFIQLLWWVGVLVLIMIDGRTQPTAVMGASTAALLAGFAFVSGPKRASNSFGA